ncbi:cation diffusion facilitator family transporter [Anaerotalea alkaliphila]|uniref:Cation transporter n=1 Tax=Anaerotalea alkaliphila TaxID=2662126 RepID=A0A7X5KN63_9FIRM|nr:cation diffusion facilitator family transporter [Anaerotalea alkaliphila]NDL66467.1 cation transporter [Anaerotalea alkaliphila]
MEAHDHTHTHGHANDGGRGGQKNIRTAFFLNLTFTLVEIVGGMATNSVAILSDAVHDLGDSLSLGIAWFLGRYGDKAPDRKFSYGYARFSLLGALVNSLVLVAGSAFVLSRAVPRIFHPQEVHAAGMMALAVLGILVNGLAAFQLNKGTSFNEKVVLWHLLEDVLGWVAILVAGLVLLFVDIPVLDPLLSLGITLYVLYHVGINLKQILHILLQGVPAHFSLEAVEEEIGKVPGVLSVHHVHLWSLEGEKAMLSAHVVVADGSGIREMGRIKGEIRKRMDGQGIGHVTIEVDFESEECGNRDCR